KHDLVADLDAISVDGQVEIAKLEDGAERIIDGLLWFKRLGAQRTRNEARRRESASFDHVRRLEHRGGGCEMGLLQRRRAETARHRAAQREALGEVVTRRKLAVQCFTEIGIVFQT